MIDRTTSVSPPPLLDEPGRRYLVVEGTQTATLSFRLDGDRLIMEHVVVPESISRRGIGATLVAAAVTRANKEDLTVVPWCPFARRWLRAHPEVAAITKIDWDSRPAT